MIDLSKLDEQMVQNVKVVLDEDRAEVVFSLPMDAGGELSYTQHFSWGPDKPSLRVKEAAKALVAALTEATRSNEAAQQEVPCTTCSSKCCGRAYSSVRVVEADLARLQAGGLNVAESVDFWDGGTYEKHSSSMDSTVGFMKMTPWTGYSKDPGEEACKYLRADGCSIYEHRPEVCRRFPAYGCSTYEAEPEKVAAEEKKAKKRRLRVSA